MKLYVKPGLEYIELRPEEGLASTGSVSKQCLPGKPNCIKTGPPYSCGQCSNFSNHV